MQELHGTSTCSLGESWDLKHAADFEMPLYMLVWDDLPHSSQHYIAPSPPALVPLTVPTKSLCDTWWACVEFVDISGVVGR